MPSATHNIIRDLGATRAWVATFRQGRDLPPVDLTGCAASLTLSDRVGGADVVLDTATGGITLGGAAGTITVDLSHASYAALGAGEYSYRLGVTYAGGGSEVLARGKWVIR